LTKHSDSGSLDIHIKGTNLEYRVGRHFEAPDVAGDEVIESIVWGANEESNERCGIEAEGSSDNIVGCIHMCAKLKHSASSGSANPGIMAEDRSPTTSPYARRDRSPSRERMDGEAGIVPEEPDSRGNVISGFQENERDKVITFRDESTKAFEDEQKEMAEVLAGIVADLETFRLNKNAKTEREQKSHEEAIQRARENFDAKMRDVYRDHRDAAHAIDRQYDKDKAHYEGMARVKEVEVRQKYVKIKEKIPEKCVVTAMRGDFPDEQADFGNDSGYDKHIGMEGYADSVTWKRNEREILMCTKELMSRWRERTSERSRSRERKKEADRDASKPQRRMREVEDSPREQPGSASGNLKGSSEIRGTF
jgi:hypothetical protein